MIIKLLAPEKETVQRTLIGCKYYGLKTVFNKKTNPYVHVEVNNEEDVVNIFWLGANLSHTKKETGLTRTPF